MKADTKVAGERFSGDRKLNFGTVSKKKYFCVCQDKPEIVVGVSCRTVDKETVFTKPPEKDL